MKALILSLMILAGLAAPAAAPAAALPWVSGLTFTAAGATLTAKDAARETFVLQVIGVTGTAGVQVQGTLDDLDAAGCCTSNWVTLYTYKVGTGVMSLTATASGVYTGSAGGFRSLRVKNHYLASGVMGIKLSWGDGVPAASPASVAAATPVP